MPDDFNVPDDMVTEQVTTKTRNKALPCELQINARPRGEGGSPYIFARWLLGRIDGGEIVDQSNHTERLQDRPAEMDGDEVVTPAVTDYTTVMNSTASAEWIRAQADPVTLQEELRYIMKRIGQFMGVNT